MVPITLVKKSFSKLLLTCWRSNVS